MKYPQTVSMPSAVSNWLEEQLEARGIDAVVYTRYILSLLHSHTVDVIYSEEDFPVSNPKKEGGKWSRGRKRSRRTSSDWWRHAHADAEHIKRSAAVECLLSATDQNCEIESLIDELCEKLKETEEDVERDAPSTPTASPSSERDARKITPQELAEKYYAAFPALCPPRSPEAGCNGSLKKKAVRKQNKLRLKENVDNIMKARSQTKPRFPYLSRNKTACSRLNFNNNNTANWDSGASTIKKKFSAAPAKPKNRSEMHGGDCDHRLEEIEWSNDGDVDMYEDLPVDIETLLDSPAPHYDAVEMMNLANMRDDGKREYVPYGANIMSSIWSTEQDVAYDNDFNAAIDGDLSLGFRFSSISIDARSAQWPAADASVEIENATNAIFESDEGRRVLRDGFSSLPSDWNATATAGDADDDKLLNHLASSLMKLNHNKEKSGFTEITPRPGAKIRSFNPFGRHAIFGLRSHHTSDKDTKEDLLTSESSHFKPIATETGVAKKYADGATFLIPNHLDKVEYKRSESGTMWLDGDNGQSKRYYEYKGEEISWSPDLDFVLKFSICQNDKACQTEETDNVDASCCGPRSLSENPVSCAYPDIETWVARARPDSAPLWDAGAGDADWAAKGDGLRDIWSGGEVGGCETCPNGEVPSLRLREDISQDGEQLLSDLSTLQQAYMEDLPPAAESARDICELLAAPKERKRRHSFLLDEDAWSFATRLEEDCLLQISSLPSLRSITL